MIENLEETLRELYRGGWSTDSIPGANADTEFDTWLNSVKAQAIRDVATGFIDWEVMYGHEETTPETEAAHATADYLWDQALRIEKGEG